MKWAGKPKRVKTTFNGRTERGKYIKPFCPEKEERKRNDPNGRGWSPPNEHLRCFCPSIPHNRPRQGRRLGLWFTLREETPTCTPCSLHCAAGKSFSRTT